MIEIDYVTYAYPSASRPALDALSLTIQAGEFLLVCGPSGAGKSTFLRLLNGLVPHFYGGRFGGDVRVWGRSTRTHQPRDLADLVGFVFQDPEAQFVVDLVEDEIAFAMENLGLPQRIMRRRVEEVLDQLGIADLRRRRVSSLSGGEQQRVAIASVLAAQPRALVLDEPTSQLDPHAAEEVLTALQKLNDDLGLTIVLCEHRLERVAQYADRVLYFPTTDDRRPTTDEGIADSDHSFCTRTNLRPSSFVLGSAREVFARIDLAPPLVRIGKALGWSPLPLTIKEGRQLVRARLDIEDWRTPPDTNQAPSSKLQAPSVTVEHAHFAYDEHEAIYDVSIAAYPGEVLALMGRNGSGKTTLLKLLAGLLKPERGTIRILDRNIIPLPVENIAAFVGYVPQDPRTLLFHDTLREELAFTLEGRKPGVRGQGSGARGRGSGVGGQGSGVRDYTTKGEGQMTNHGQRTTDNGQISISNTLERFDLAHLANAYPRDLSGGEAQRTALATILVGDPPVLLLDEPTRGLDYDAKGALGQLLRRLASEGKTIIIVTHDVELVAAYADRVALLGDGEIIVDGPTRDVLSDSLTLSPQIAKLFPGTGLLTVEDALRSIAKPDA